MPCHHGGSAGYLPCRRRGGDGGKKERRARQCAMPITGARLTAKSSRSRTGGSDLSRTRFRADAHGMDGWRNRSLLIYHTKIFKRLLYLFTVIIDLKYDVHGFWVLQVTHFMLQKGGGYPEIWCFIYFAY